MLENLKVLLLQKLVLLPYQEARVEISTELSKQALDASEKYFNNKIIVVSPLSETDVNHDIKDLPKVGVLAKIKSKIELPNGNYRVALYGLNRVQVLEYRDNDDLLECTIKRLYIQHKVSDEEKAMVRSLKNLISEYMETNPEVSNAVTNTISNITDLDMLTDIITNFMPLDTAKKCDYMNEFDYKTRANNLIRDINVELEVINIENKVDDEIREKLSKEQRRSLTILNALFGSLLFTSDNIATYDEEKKAMFDEAIKIFYNAHNRRYITKGHLIDITFELYGKPQHLIYDINKGVFINER